MSDYQITWHGGLKLYKPDTAVTVRATDSAVDAAGYAKLAKTKASEVFGKFRAREVKPKNERLAIRYDGRIVGALKVGSVVGRYITIQALDENDDPVMLELVMTVGDRSIHRATTATMSEAELSDYIASLDIPSFATKSINHRLDSVKYQWTEVELELRDYERVFDLADFEPAD